MPRFYNSTFDPWLIVLQIVVMQSLFYCSIGFFLFFFGLLLGVPIFLEQIFSASAVGLSDATSVVVLLSFASTSITCAIFLVIVVERAKKCLDFVATVHIFHFVGCLIYAGFPTAWIWWLLMLLSIVCMTMLGEYLCWKQEMKEIPIRSVAHILEV